MLYEEKQIETIPVGPLGLIPLKSCETLGKKVDAWLTGWRNERESEHKSTIAFAGYQRDSYIVGARTPRFGSGEGKGEILESVRGDDLYILVDVCNYSLTYSLSGIQNHMSPDDHYQDLKRVIASVGGKARRINVIMPFLYQFIKHLLKHEKDLQIDSDHMMVISPDEGGMGRAVFFANVLGLDLGMFYKRRDYTKIINGRNPIVAHEFLGASVEGKDVIIIDDMISSGESMLDTAKELKRRKARKVFICTTFGLFTNGLKKFDEYYENGVIDRVLTTNLIYQTPELLSKPYYIDVDMSKYIALIIDNLNHDSSLSELLNPTKRINRLLERYRAGER